MSLYLSENKFWLQPSPHIGVLDGKSILIIEGEFEYQARLVVSYEHAGDFDSEHCTVSVQKVFEKKPLWNTPLPDTIQPPSHECVRKQYLSQRAVDSIHNAVDSLHGELVLVITQE